jgi:glyoxylase-like metal-dependent hydrolase (beta-lactamase superfamily II)
MAPKEVARGVWVVTGGAFPSNSYICATGASDEVFLVDVGLDHAPIDAALDALGARPVGVYCTHGHFDHLGAARHFQDKYSVAVHLHAEDLKTARMNNFLLMALKLDDRIVLPEITAVDSDFSAAFGSESLVYRHTPGHTPGSCVLAFGTNLFTGDTMYSHGVGLSKLPGERPEVLRQSIVGLWDDLPGFTVHPGHGPSAPGAMIRANNTALRSFLGIASENTGTHA